HQPERDKRGRRPSRGRNNRREIEVLCQHNSSELFSERHDLRVIRRWRQQIRYAEHIVPKRDQKVDGRRRNVQVGQHPHAMTVVCSLASHAPYLAAWKTSSLSSSGYSRTISSAV